MHSKSKKINHKLKILKIIKDAKNKNKTKQ